MNPEDKGGGPTRDDISSEDDKEDNDSIESPPFEQLKAAEEKMDTSSSVDDTSNHCSQPPLATSAANSITELALTVPLAVPSTSYQNQTDLPSGSAFLQAPNQTNGTSDSTASPAPRKKAYPPGSTGPFLVFFRPKGKPLNN